MPLGCRPACAWALPSPPPHPPPAWGVRACADRACGCGVGPSAKRKLGGNRGPRQVHARYRNIYHYDSIGFVSDCLLCLCSKAVVQLGSYAFPLLALYCCTCGCGAAVHPSTVQAGGAVLTNEWRDTRPSIHHDHLYMQTVRQSHAGPCSSLEQASTTKVGHGDPNGAAAVNVNTPASKFYLHC